MRKFLIPTLAPGSCFGAVFIAASVLLFDAAAEAKNPESGAPGGKSALRALRSPTGIKLRPVVGWGEGESMTFALKIAGVEAGRAAFTVGQVKERSGRPTLILRGLSETVPFITAFYKRKEDLVTTVDAKIMLPIFVVNKREAPGKDRTLKVIFSDSELEFQIQTATDKQTRKAPSPAVRYDLLSLVYSLRSAELFVGQQFVVRAIDGLNLQHVEVKVEGRERIYSANGPKDTLRISGRIRQINDRGQPIPGKPNRRVTCWVSADEMRLPLKVEAETGFGFGEASLTSYHPPRRRLTFPEQP